jgi:hypothetical protein
MSSREGTSDDPRGNQKSLRVYRVRNGACTNPFISAEAYDSVERRAAEHQLACCYIHLFDHRVDADL